MNCDKCSAARINGVFCHESGCPNSGKTWDEDRQDWIKYVDCFECGFPVEVGEHCDCQDFSDDPYNPSPWSSDEDEDEDEAEAEDNYDFDFEGDEPELDEDLY